MYFDSHAICAQVLKQLISCLQFIFLSFYCHFGLKYQIDLAMHGFLDQNRLEVDFTEKG